MADSTDRLQFPFIIQGQAQKELTHNEALTRADIAIQSVVVAVGVTIVPVAPLLGQCWIVGAGATGVWAGQEGALAGWTSGGWRFVTPFEGMAVWSLADQKWVQRTSTAWAVGAANAASYAINGTTVVKSQRAPIANPVGGTVIDSESRIALEAILTALRGHGLIATSL
jgi:hypothetical protein